MEHNRLIVARVLSFPDECRTIRVTLKAPRYVLVNGTASLQCRYDVSENSIHKVEWLRGGSKIYQYIKGRNPPYNNFSIAGAEIDVSTFHCIYVQYRDIVNILFAAPPRDKWLNAYK